MAEQEEKDLREKLNKEIPNGCYEIGVEGSGCWTGKGGYIDFEIMLRKALEDIKPIPKENIEEFCLTG